MFYLSNTFIPRATTTVLTENKEIWMNTIYNIFALMIWVEDKVIYPLATLTLAQSRGFGLGLGLERSLFRSLPWRRGHFFYRQGENPDPWNGSTGRDPKQKTTRYRLEEIDPWGGYIKTSERMNDLHKNHEIIVVQMLDICCISSPCSFS